ncbi:YCII-related domain protein [Asticcacaulis biprosthecium C19]|uniref:YCII-related domain protein n=1 Tax=Asticcacaulis biprosthecium C19 TaxID=715226 RepID=F4QPU1_9CAUL|nr:YciI family protein [Asticcacaulis biprosthecium]EGF90228.1 YCII-related domain protein [Asticcacaulis biprosthecium C19]
MIIVLLTYKVSTEELDTSIDAHRDWLMASIEAGRLLAAGRKVPRTGGMLLARGDLDQVKTWAATDPFAVNGLADYDFTEVAVTLTADGLDGLK